MSPAFLTGERVSLRPLIEADADGPYVTWFNDAEVCRGNSHHVFPYTREQALSYIRQSTQGREMLVLAIVLKGDQRHIGNIALQGIHSLNRSAEFAIVIGDKSTWGQGYGHEAAALLFEHAFKTLNLHRIACGTFADNAGMIKLAAALGMKQEGVRRQAVFKDGRYQDVVEYGLLREEFSPVSQSNRQ